VRRVAQNGALLDIISGLMDVGGSISRVRVRIAMDRAVLIRAACRFDRQMAGILRSVKRDLLGDASMPPNSGTMQIQRGEEWRWCHCRILRITPRPPRASYARSVFLSLSCTGANHDLRQST